MIDRMELRMKIRKKFPDQAVKELWYVKWGAARKRKLIKLSEAQNHRCCFCGCQTWINERDPKTTNSRMATLEHIICQTHGGTDAWHNLVMACMGCNSFRGTMDIDEFYAVRHDPIIWEKFLKARRAHQQKTQSTKKAERYGLHTVALAFLYNAMPGLHEVMEEMLAAA